MTRFAMTLGGVVAAGTVSGLLSAAFPEARHWFWYFDGAIVGALSMWMIAGSGE